MHISPLLPRHMVSFRLTLPICCDIFHLVHMGLLLTEFDPHDSRFTTYFSFLKETFNDCFLNLADRLALIREQRAEAAKKREEEKAGSYLHSSRQLLSNFYFLHFHLDLTPQFLLAAKEQKKLEARK